MVDKVMFDSHALIHGGHGHGGHEHGEHEHHDHEHDHKHGERSNDDESLASKHKQINYDDVYSGDPAAQRLVSNIKKSMLLGQEKLDKSQNRADARKSMI